MAYAFDPADTAFFFAGPSRFSRHGGRGGTCRANASAFAGMFGRPSCPARACAWASASRGEDAFSARRSELVNTPESFFIFFDASGFRREDVKITVTDGQLRLTANKDGQTTQASWALPEGVLEGGISAKFEGQELIIAMPKVQAVSTESFDVPIETGSAALNEADPAPGNVDATDASGDGMQAENGQEVDGSWVEVPDEDVLQAKAKDKAPAGTSVFEDAQDSQPGRSNASDQAE